VALKSMLDGKDKVAVQFDTKTGLIPVSILIIDRDITGGRRW
jgi:hypothetical protein